MGSVHAHVRECGPSGAPRELYCRNHFVSAHRGSLWRALRWGVIQAVGVEKRESARTVIVAELAPVAAARIDGAVRGCRGR